jgi:hypothetical protein
MCFTEINGIFHTFMNIMHARILHISCCSTIFFFSVDYFLKKHSSTWKKILKFKYRQKSSVFPVVNASK